jgi:hypothetical protein
MTMTVYYGTEFIQVQNVLEHRALGLFQESFVHIVGKWASGLSQSNTTPYSKIC